MVDFIVLSGDVSGEWTTVQKKKRRDKGRKRKQNSN
jgi:hypothetical protein